MLGFCFAMMGVCAVLWDRVRGLSNQIAALESQAIHRDSDSERIKWCMARIADMQAAEAKRTTKPAPPYRACGCQCHEGGS